MNTRFRQIPLLITTVSFLTALALIATHSSLAKDKAAPEPPKYAAWKDVDSFTAEGTGTDHWWHYGSNRDEWKDDASTTSVQYHFEMKVSTTASPRATSLFWNVQNCQASGTEDYHSRGGTPFRKSDHWHKGAMSGPTTKGGALKIDLVTGKWDLITESFMAKPYRCLGHSHYEHDPFPWKVDDSAIDFENTNIPGLSVQGELAGTKPGVISGTKVQKDIKPGPIESGSIRTYRVVMWPNYRDVECIVEIQKYGEWLPAANLMIPDQPGSRLGVKATLRPKDNGAKTAIRASRYRFELVDTSHEPGVCMNFPPLAQGETPPPDDPNADIKIGFYGCPGDYPKDGQHAFVKPVPDDREGHDWAQVFVDAFDFGGHASLHVICELNDGREIPGILRDPEASPTADITIPKRSGGSKIADSWRKKYDLGTNDGDDLDREPAGDGNVGDGFSNYEEYRGFVINGRHVRTDPTKKDIFIKNKIGPAALEGLELFAGVTELAAHYDLKDAEMPPSRVMNLNRSAQSPHNSQELQHGLVLVYVGTGNASSTTSRGNIFRPKYVDQVVIQKSNATPLKGKKDLTESQKLTLKSTIAHELCHAVGVPHHGSGDLHQVSWTLGQRKLSDGTTDSWIEERESTWNDAKGRYEASTAPGDEIRVFDTDGVTEIKPGDKSLPLPQTLYVAVHGGECSGNDQCLMRYNFANAYILPEYPRRRYFSPQEPPGLQLCTSKDGTGINPQRYGNATTGGDCKHQFAVRDDAPQRTR